METQDHTLQEIKKHAEKEGVKAIVVEQQYQDQIKGLGFKGVDVAIYPTEKGQTAMDHYEHIKKIEDYLEKREWPVVHLVNNIEEMSIVLKRVLQALIVNELKKERKHKTEALQDIGILIEHARYQDGELLEDKIATWSEEGEEAEKHKERIEVVVRRLPEVMDNPAIKKQREEARESAVEQFKKYAILTVKDLENKEEVAIEQHKKTKEEVILEQAEVGMQEIQQQSVQVRIERLQEGIMAIQERIAGNQVSEETVVAQKGLYDNLKELWDTEEMRRIVLGTTYRVWKLQPTQEAKEQLVQRALDQIQPPEQDNTKIEENEIRRALLQQEQKYKEQQYAHYKAFFERISA